MKLQPPWRNSAPPLGVLSNSRVVLLEAFGPSGDYMQWPTTNIRCLQVMCLQGQLLVVRTVRPEHVLAL